MILKDVTVFSYNVLDILTTNLICDKTELYKVHKAKT